MKVSKNILFILLLLLSHGIFSENTGGLSEDSILKVKKSVYEVIVKKPDEKNITYEKELPMHLIPFAIRTDKYYSIGSAFAIGANQFVSAAHVFLLGEGSQYKEIFLRNNNGEVFQIDKIVKYSDHRDFVFFTLLELKNNDFLPLNEDPKLNNRVYAVGNAHGEGIIIRDGLLTSETPEEEEGEWNWLRFSAAASPGNSGGPLLDTRGAVIGVILKKSESENLNFALPIKEVIKFKKDTAISHKKFAYRLDNMNRVNHEEYNFTTELPKSYPDLNNILYSHMKQYTETLLNDTYKKYESTIFPNGEKSLALLHDTRYATIFPNLIAESKDGYWSTYRPSEIQTSDLKNNGYLKYGSLDNYYLLYIKKPDNLPLAEFINNSKTFMDTVLEGIPLTRTIGSDKVRITSLDKATESFQYKDKYNRNWIVNSWLIPYSDEKVLIFTLPIPGGSISILRLGSTGRVDINYMIDTKIMTDFIYYSYYGTLNDWKEFLALKDILPEAFSKIKFEYESGKKLSFQNQLINVTYNTSVLEINDDSDMQLVFSYFYHKKKLKWDISGVIFGANKNTQTAFSIYRTNKPDQKLKDSYIDDWDKIMNKKFPYNKLPYANDGETTISSTYPVLGDKNQDPEYIYTITYSEDGTVKDEKVENILNKIFSSTSFTDISY